MNYLYLKTAGKRLLQILIPLGLVAEIRNPFKKYFLSNTTTFDSSDSLYDITI